jgi:hypothetical protein
MMRRRGSLATIAILGAGVLVPAVPMSAATASGPAVTAAGGEERPAPDRFDVRTTTVGVAQVTSATPYTTWRVPECADEIAYMIDGGAGGASRPVGTTQHAAGGLASVRAGTLDVTPGEVLRFYPASRGEGAIPSGTTGDAGGGGQIGYAAGGGGSGTDTGTAWGTRGNPGGGGGAASAITSASGAPIAIAAGGGGAGGAAWSSTALGTVGGNGDTDGRDGSAAAGSKGLAGAQPAATGGLASDPGGVVQGGGGGGGGGGYRGGSGGRGAADSTRGGGSGGGGSSFVDGARAGSGQLADYGLDSAAVTPTGDGNVTIAWYGCASVVSIEGVEESAAGAQTPASAWSYSVSAAGGLVQPGTGTTDATGRMDVTVRGYESASDSLLVTVTQAPRTGWPIDSWSAAGGGWSSGTNAVCVLTGETAVRIVVTDIGADGFAIAVPADTWVRCRIVNVEASPSMTISKTAPEVADGLPATEPTAAPHVVSGTTVTWSYRVRNTGNVPLTDLAIADDGVAAVVCPTTALLPDASVTCTATGVVRRG